MIGAVVFSVFAIGLIFTTLDKSDYLLLFDTYIYFFKNILLLLPHTPETLPGVFTQTNVTAVVNAPLWSLPYELICYLSLPILGFLTQAKNKKMIFTLIVILLFIFMYGIFIYNFSYRLEILSSFISKDGYRLFSIFFMGSITYLFSQYIVLSWRILLASIFLIVFYILFDFRTLLVGTSFLVMGYGILFIAYLPVGIIRNYNELGDYSYGIYIFGYPIQQAVEHLYPTFSLLTYTFVSLSITLVLAILSWHWIERYFLSFK